MKLLFDEHLSPKLISRLWDLFPDSAHVFDCGLGATEDRAIWDHAKRHGFAVVSKDADFYARASCSGTRPSCSG